MQLTSPAAAGTVLSPGEWRARRDRHISRVRPLVEPRLERRRRGAKHPVDDFLFEYYALRPAQLLAWHPGVGVVLAGEPVPEHEHYADVAGGRTVNPTGLLTGDNGGGGPRASARHLPREGERGSRPSTTGLGRVPARAERSLAILRGTAARPAALGCFGLHEWALVLGQDPQEVRHAPVPLRIDAQTLSGTVAAVGLRCTHFDAFRFFTPQAAAQQRPLTPADRLASEQPGCIHAGMDLYRHAFQALPYVPSELVADCFVFARRCREVDMRASPYDLSAFGLAAIPMEEPRGRREYADLQRALAADSEPLRRRVIAALETVLRAAARVAD